VPGSKFGLVVGIGPPRCQGLLDLRYHRWILGKDGSDFFPKRIRCGNAGHLLDCAVPDENVPGLIGHHHTVNDPRKDVCG
jgi:hypothetical protein